MPLVVVGSVALDSVETPAHGKRDDVLGGSAVFFSYTASFFTSVRLAGVIGEDWPPQHLKMLQERSIDTAGLQVIPDVFKCWGSQSSPSRQATGRLKKLAV